MNFNAIFNATPLRSYKKRRKNIEKIYFVNTQKR